MDERGKKMKEAVSSVRKNIRVVEMLARKINNERKFANSVIEFFRRFAIAYLVFGGGRIIRNDNFRSKNGALALRGEHMLP